MKEKSFITLALGCVTCSADAVELVFPVDAGAAVEAGVRQALVDVVLAEESAETVRISFVVFRNDETRTDCFFRGLYSHQFIFFVI
jgi:hypothetical protein